LYGAATILKTYAGVSQDRSIRAVVPHGVYYRRSSMTLSEKLAQLPAALAFPPYRVRTYARHGKLAIPSTSPFVYASRLLEPDAVRRGNLFIPVHSTVVITVETDWESIASRLVEWQAGSGRVDVLIYWRDYQLGRHRPFVDKGLRVVSAGHYNDPDFLLRQVHLLSQYEGVLTNGPGSHVFYA